MSCFYHPEREGKFVCVHCGKSLCDECMIEVDGKVYCKECVKDEVKKVTTYEKKKSPGLAAVLAIVPGLGAIYNGQVLKAVTFILIFGILIGIQGRARGVEEVIFGLLIAGFYFFMIVDAYNTAKSINLGEEYRPTLKLGKEEGSIFWGMVLIVLGVIFQLANWRVFSYDDVLRLWPLILIFISFRMLYVWHREARKREEK
ncbi:MAG: DUF5668 domain-containing protein [Acidobacteriota bacterium]